MFSEPFINLDHVFGHVLHYGLQVGLAVGRIVFLCGRLRQEGGNRNFKRKANLIKAEGYLPISVHQSQAERGRGRLHRSLMDGSVPCRNPGGSVPENILQVCASQHQP